MADGSHIEWTDATWNPVTGCTRVSAGCDRCYIERTPPLRMAGRRFDQPGIGGTTGVQLHEGRMFAPVAWRKPRMIFLGSLADVFHAEVRDDYLAKIWATMARTPRHTYQVLTKRPARMRSLLASPEFVASVTRIIGAPVGWPLPNVWCGVSVEDQAAADLRLPILAQVPAVVHWVSAEPLLGPVDLSAWMPAGRVQWVVTGGESGPGSRPAAPDWFRQIRDQCTQAGVAYLHKQHGDWIQDGWAAGVSVRGWRQVGEPGADGLRADMRRVGKKTAGRSLDGVIHDSYPDHDHDVAGAQARPAAAGRAPVTVLNLEDLAAVRS